MFFHKCKLYIVWRRFIAKIILVNKIFGVKKQGTYSKNNQFFMVSYRFYCAVIAHFWKKDQITILADREILLIKVVETHQLSGKLSNLCQPPEINYFYKKKVFLSQKIKDFSNLSTKFKFNRLTLSLIYFNKPDN